MSIGLQGFLIEIAAGAALWNVWLAWVAIKPKLLRQKSEEQRESFSDAFDIALIFSVAIVFGLYVVARALFNIHDQFGPGVFAGLLWSLAWLAVGTGLGFLFGVPKVIQDQQQPQKKDAQSSGGNNAQDPTVDYRQRVNSNLEEISDWLTKIIVGVGLVELAKAYSYFLRAATAVGATLDFTQPSSKEFGAGVIIFFSTVGFLSTYLLTRLFLTGALFRAERGNGLSAQNRAQVTSTEKSKVDQTAAESSQENARQVLQTSGDLKQAVLASAARYGAEGVASRLIDKNDFSTLKTAEDFGDWAKAKFSTGEFQDAVLAYEKAVGLAPQDPELRLNYANALYYENPNRPIADIQAQLVQAYNLITPQTSISLLIRIYRDLVFNYLYDTEHKGYERAIILAEKYVNNPQYVPDARIWFYLACALGQKYQALAPNMPIQQGLETPEMLQIKNRAAAAIREALKLDPSLGSTIESLLKADQTADDNDLWRFNTSEFRSMAGLPTNT